jgi:flotillin
VFSVFLIVIIAVVTLVALLVAIGSVYRRCGPNQALIVFGWGGTQIITGGGKLVIPVFQNYQELSLELMSFDVAPEQDLFTAQGVAVSVEAVAQIKVKSDPQSIRTASEQLLTKNQTQRENLIRLVMEGHLRGITGLLTVEQIVKEPEMVASRFRQTVADDLSKMGLEVVSFTIKKVMDEQEYINNMGRPDVARVKREAEIAQAEAERDISIKRAIAEREAATAKAQADQERVIAQTASETKQAEAMRDMNLKKAEYDASVNEQKAHAEKAYEIAQNQAQQKVIAEQTKIAQVEKQEMIRVTELEVQRRQLELEANIIRQSEAERKRIEMMAEAEKARLTSEATGQAEARKLAGQAEAEYALATGRAQAEIQLAQGRAQAEVVEAKGQAEAEAMRKQADAYQHYNQAAVLDKMVSALPEIARAFADAFAKVDKITIVSTGDGKGTSALTSDVARMVAQVPQVVETITGVKIGDMFNKVTSMADIPETGVIPVTAIETPVVPMPEAKEQPAQA